MRKTIVLVALGWLCWGALSVAAMQPQLPKVSIPNIPSATQIQARIAELEASTELEDDTRATAIAMYKGAGEALTAATGFSQKAADFNQKAADAPGRLASIRSELAQPPAETVISPPPQATLAQLEQEQSQAAATLTAAKQLLADLQTETTHRNELRAQLSERLVKARQELGDLRDAGVETVPENAPQVVQDARRTLQRAQALSLQREIEAIEAELASYDARRELLPARRDLAQRKVTEAEKAVAAWQSLVASRRQQDAEQTAADAQRLRREAARQHPVLKRFADETVDRANKRVRDQNSSQSADSYAQRLARANAQLAQVDSEFESIQKRLKATGLNRTTGLVLRNHYETLPDLSLLGREIRSTQQQLEDTDYRLIELQEQRTESGDIDRVATDLVSKIPDNELNGNQAELLQIARELASARRNLLDQLIGDASNQLEQLDQLNTTLRLTEEEVQAYKNFIEERILWVRSIAADRTPRLRELTSDATAMLDPKPWRSAWAADTAFIRTHWLRVLLMVMLLLALWGVSLRSTRRLVTLGELASRYTTDSFQHTMEALLLTAIKAAPFAMTLLLLSWLLRAPEEQTALANALGDGLRSAAFFFYPLAFLRQMLRTNGLALAHFRWSRETIMPIRRGLRWFVPASVVLVLLVTTIDRYGDESTSATLGRLLFTIEMLVLAIFLHRVLHPRGVVLERFMGNNAGGWVHRLRYIWYLLAVLLPVFFAVLSWAGFHYTALQLESNLQDSLVLALVLVVVSGVMHRWLFVARRRLAVEDAKRRRAMAIAELETKPVAGESTTTTVAAVDEEKVDLPSISEQTRQIFRSAIAVSVVIGLYIIWAQALPALRMLDQVQLWPTPRIIQDTREPEIMPRGWSESHRTTTQNPALDQGQSQNETSGGLQPTPSVPIISPSSAAAANDNVGPGGDEPVSITLADVGLALVVLVATIIAFRNIPGLLEIVILQRLPLDAGSRYALSTVLRYLIAIIGVLIAFQTLGISWSKVQWLAAALTFGLAFGLQEIFANFVSGLIILAERPIRMGDTITVGGITGTVMRIRMRATTITDWDRKELIIPNKSFITGDVINWTLSDTTLRVKIPIGVSYSSDTDKVERLLKSIARDNPTVMTDPGPQVLFSGFGESTLDFELRVFIPHIDFYVPVRHALHSAIYKAFKKADIEIAFPQRDLHVRSIGDLAKLIDRGEQPPASPSQTPPDDAPRTSETPGA